MLFCSGPDWGTVTTERRSSVARPGQRRSRADLAFDGSHDLPILVEYAKWTAQGRQSPRGAPIKKKETVYRLLDRVAFGEVLSGEAEI